MLIIEYFEDVETTQPHEGYFHSVGEAPAIVILGSFCGLANASQIHHWATNERTRAFLAERFGIHCLPSYSVLPSHCPIPSRHVWSAVTSSCESPLWSLREAWRSGESGVSSAAPPHHRTPYKPWRKKQGARG